MSKIAAPVPIPVQRPVLALGLRVIAAFAINTMFMFGKRAAETGVALPEVMFWRQVVTLPMLLGYLAINSGFGNGGLSRLRTGRIRSHALRAGSGSAGMFCNLLSVTLLPLAESTTFNFAAPLFAVIITALILREHVGLWRWTAVVFGFAGVLVITQPGHLPIPALGAAAGLISALFNASISFQIRDLGRTEEPISVVFYFALFGTLLMTLFMPFYYTPHTLGQWGLLLGVGVAGTIGQLFMTAALRLGSVLPCQLLGVSLWRRLVAVMRLVVEDHDAALPIERPEDTADHPGGRLLVAVEVAVRAGQDLLGQ